MTLTKLSRGQNKERAQSKLGSSRTTSRAQQQIISCHTKVSYFFVCNGRAALAQFVSFTELLITAWKVDTSAWRNRSNWILLRSSD